MLWLKMTIKACLFSKIGAGETRRQQMNAMMKYEYLAVSLDDSEGYGGSYILFRSDWYLPKVGYCHSGMSVAEIHI